MRGCIMIGMDLELNATRTLVFGAANGIGLAIARQFAAEGASVTGFDAASEPDPFGELGDIVSGDVTDFDAVRGFVAQVEVVDHVVYSVGVGSGRFGFPFWNLEPKDWRRVLDVNLIGAVNVAHACAPRLIERGSGSMLFLVSVAGQIGSQTDPPYSAAKAGLINFVQCAAKDLAPHNVRVNALAPGMVKSDLNRSVWAAAQANLPEAERVSYEEWGREKVGKVAPLGRWQQPEEMAAMAAFLASKHAANITGQTINIDGGQVMHS